MRPELRDERRRHIADAVITLAAERGIEGVSLRIVARQADTSTGQIQYQFGTMDELTLFALERVVATLDGFIDEAPRLSGQDRLRSITQRLLASDPDTSRCLRAYGQLRTLATRDERCRAVVEDADRRRREEIADVLQQAKSNWLLHGMVEPEQEADVLWSLLVAIAIETAQGLRDSASSYDLVQYHVARLARNKLIAAPRRKRSRATD